jgi:hypothetical protein
MQGVGVVGVLVNDLSVDLLGGQVPARVLVRHRHLQRRLDRHHPTAAATLGTLRNTSVSITVNIR